MSAYQDLRQSPASAVRLADLLAYHPGAEPVAASARRDVVLAREADPVWQAFAYWEPV